MSLRRVLGLALALIAAAPSAGAAQDVAVRAYLSPDGTVGVGRPFKSKDAICLRSRR
jgi:hypothetical protein